jgi:hypothetical protein
MMMSLAPADPEAAWAKAGEMKIGVTPLDGRQGPAGCGANIVGGGPKAMVGRGGHEAARAAGVDARRPSR